jgi:hypothetical protein
MAEEIQVSYADNVTAVIVGCEAPVLSVRFAGKLGSQLVD